MDAPLKIAILGAGALGSVLGAELCKRGAEVALLDTNDAHIAAINANGLRVDWDDTSERIRLKASRPEKAESADLIILLTKTLHSGAALASVRPLIDAGACVMTLQNGLGNIERLAGFVDRTRLLYGCTMTPGDMRGPGHVASHGLAYTPFIMLERGGAGEEVAMRLAKLLPWLTEDAPSQVWQKAAFNCAVNAPAGLGKGTVGDLARHLGLQGAGRIADEVLALAAAEGVRTDRDSVHRQIAFAFEHHVGHKPSLLQDLENGRKTEIEALNGYVSRRSAELLLEAPLNDLLAGLVRMIEARELVYLT